MNNGQNRFLGQERRREGEREKRFQNYYSLGILTLESTGNTVNDILALITDLIHTLGTAIEAVYEGLVRGEIGEELSKILGRVATEGLGAVGVAVGSIVRGLINAVKNFMEVMKAGKSEAALDIFPTAY